MYILVLSHAERGSGLLPALKRISSDYSLESAGSFRVGLYNVQWASHPVLALHQGNTELAEDGCSLIVGRPIQDATGVPSGLWVKVGFESESGRLTIERDFAGLAAAFYVLGNGYCLLSDSVPVLLQFGCVSRVIDCIALNQTWFVDYCFAPRTIWRDIRAVPNGHRAELRLTSPETATYVQTYIPGSYSHQIGPIHGSLSKTLRTRILNVTERCLAEQAQAPANLLSAGVDSSVVFAACNVLGQKPQVAITFKSEGDSDESVLAARTASHFRVPLHVVTAQDMDLIDAARHISRLWGQPYGHSSVTSMMALLKGLPPDIPLFTGDGGGEAFGQPPPPDNPPLRGLGRLLESGWKRLPKRSRQAAYQALAIRSDLGRKAFYWKEWANWRTAGEFLAMKSTITEADSDLVWHPDLSDYFCKKMIGQDISQFARMAPLDDESEYARSWFFWWAPEGVYAKTWRILDAMGTLGFAPLTAPAFIESVKAVPMAERGTRKQALRDSFAAELPREILEAPGRGLSSLNRELLVGAWKDGIDWFTSVNLEESGEWFTIGSIEAMWRAHANRTVFRTNLLFKVIVFRAWMEMWKPVLPDRSRL
jgi:hypothetical protein